MTINRWLAATAISASAILLTTFLSAQPLGESIMEEVEFIPSSSPCDPDLAIIHMHYPVRYVSHYPQNVSEELRIRVLPLNVSQLDSNELDQRESTVPEGNFRLLDEVIYEGDFHGDPILTLRYFEPVRSRVLQGNDFRTIKVLIYPSARINQEKCQ